MIVKFLHLHKTAGTSVRLFLRGLFPPHEVCPAITHQELCMLTPDQLRTYRVFAGHFDWSKLDEIDGPSFTFTVLRDPVERLVSNYFFWRTQAQAQKTSEAGLPHLRAALELAPDAFFAGHWIAKQRKLLDDQDNLYTRYFAGRGFASRQPLAIRLMSDDELLAAANRNLDLLDGLYSTNDLHILKADINAAIFGRRDLGWRSIRARLYPIRLVKSNRTAGDLSSRLSELRSLGATNRTFTRIEEMTRLDKTLWVERFHHRPSVSSLQR